MKALQGIHHVTAITSSAPKIYEFYTKVLGMRLVKKNVNQDDLTTYHLFFADDRGNPGTDMTFFDFKGIQAHQKGTNDISRTSFRVPSDAAIEYWVKRFDHYEIAHEDVKNEFGHKVLYFEDFDKQQYALISDEKNEGIGAGEPWHHGPVPDEFAIVGLGPIYLKVSRLDLMDQILVHIMLMEKTLEESNLHRYEMGLGGNGAAVIVDYDVDAPQAYQGFGGVHHVAFRVDDRAHLDQWINHFNNLQLGNSGFVERFYFQSNYIRIYPNILFELATDGPGFIDDQETYEELGSKTTLPPHLRHRKEYIDKHLKHFDSTWPENGVEKEYL